MFLHDGLCGRAEIASSRVIAKALPGVQNLVLRSGGQGREIGEPLHPPTVVRDDRSDLRLLEHELGHQDGVRIFGATPGEIAPLFSIPDKEQATERCGVDDRVRANRGTVQRQTFNVQR